MNPNRLKRFQGLYRLSEYMGAARILRGFLGLEYDAPIPLSLSHGVDCAQYRNPIDVESIEPLHWSYNANIYSQAIRVKPSIMAPHPWSVVASNHGASAGNGVLLIGPPPSPANDARLYDLVSREQLSDWSVLVKARGEFLGSVRFWRDHGLQTITAGAADDTFHERLLAMLMRFETIVGCSFSSALIFAASVGKNIILLRDYTWETYDTSNFLDTVWLESPRARSTVHVFANGTRREKTDAARELLGFDMLGQAAKVRQALESSIRGLKRPFHHHLDNPIPYKVRELLTRYSRKQGFLRYSTKEVFALARRRQVGILRMNDIDAWLNGRSPENCSLTPVKFQKGVTEPGRAPKGYPSFS